MKNVSQARLAHQQESDRAHSLVGGFHYHIVCWRHSTSDLPKCGDH